MSFKKFEITIITSDQTDVLFELMRVVGMQRMMYRCNTKISKDRISKILLTVEGSLLGGKLDLISAIEKLPSVEFVEDVEEILVDQVFKAPLNSSAEALTIKPNKVTSAVKKNNKKVNLSRVSLNSMLKSHDVITPDVLKVAETKLSDFLGPVAPILVKQVSTTMNVSSVGQLFEILAKELNDNNERAEFLSIIETRKDIADFEVNDQKTVIS